jgi:uncharacterized RDD family membrane protein YckC
LAKEYSEITIETPEHFELTFTLAGIGSRFTAYIFDKLLQFCVIMICFLSIISLSYIADQVSYLDSTIQSIKKVIAPWIIGILILIYGTLTIGYFIVFEYFWSGRTPGKRSQKIRVIRYDGRPITLWDSLIRNILRSIDILGEVYPIGLVIMLFDSKKRRLGDLVAGTCVIVDKSSTKLELAPALDLMDERDQILRSFVAAMNHEDFRVISSILARKDEIGSQHAHDLELEIVTKLKEKSGFYEPISMDLKQLLEKLQRLYMQKTRII